jgi:hypothetical protein
VRSSVLSATERSDEGSIGSLRKRTDINVPLGEDEESFEEEEADKREEMLKVSLNLGKLKRRVSQKVPKD